ncbi:hypothetical protein LCGC14_2948680 [marine sediment metagenome]|uniref:Uncharacterized protein n=1 Tax=marine sediment metagenome TaxID=412755 RepID=A0A0F8XGH5_9ZZZZ
MSEDKDDKIQLELEIQNKLEEISRILNIPPTKVLNASLLHGLNRYRFPLQKYNSELKVEEQPVKEEEYQPILSDLKSQIELSYEIIQDIDEFESRFENKYPFGTFSDFQEREREYIKFIETLNRPPDVGKEEPPRIVITKKVTKAAIKKEELEDKKEKKVIKLVVFIIVCIIANFFIFYGFFFDFGYHWQFNPYLTSFIIISVIVMILLSSTIIGKILYYIFNKFRNKKSPKRI